MSTTARKERSHDTLKSSKRCYGWVLERTLAWLSKCRALLIRYDKHAANFLALLQFACALLWYRRRVRLTGAETGTGTQIPSR